VRFVDAKIEWLSVLHHPRATATNQNHRRLGARLRSRSNQRVQAGADEYLLKPITWELLSSTIDRLLPAIPRPPRPKPSAERDSTLPRINCGASAVQFRSPEKAQSVTGGNTSCVEVRADGEIHHSRCRHRHSLASGSLDKEFGAQSMKLTLLITPYSLDHIQGLPFFSPAYNRKKISSAF